MAVTRAQALTIVVGNPRLLRQDANWRAFINHAYDLGGYCGVPYERHVDPAAPAAADTDPLSQRMARMGLVDAEDSSSNSPKISQRQLQEVPEWRADF